MESFLWIFLMWYVLHHNWFHMGKYLGGWSISNVILSTLKWNLCSIIIRILVISIPHCCHFNFYHPREKEWPRIIAAENYFHFVLDLPQQIHTHTHKYCRHLQLFIRNVWLEVCLQCNTWSTWFIKHLHFDEIQKKNMNMRKKMIVLHENAYMILYLDDMEQWAEHNEKFSNVWQVLDVENK